MRKGWIGLTMLLAGCLPDGDNDGTIRLACLGDSNTQAGWGTPPITRWCEHAQALAPTRLSLCGNTACPKPATWINLGQISATVVDHSDLAPGWPWIGPQVAAALAQQADVFVVALGANDVWFDTPPAVVVAGLLAVRDQVAPRPLWVVVPPRFVVAGHATGPIGDAIGMAFGGRAIDGRTGMTFVADGVHLDATSQATLAARVVAVVQ